MIGSYKAFQYDKKWGDDQKTIWLLPRFFSEELLALGTFFIVRYLIIRNIIILLTILYDACIFILNS